MTTTDSPALDVARAYHRAWAAHDLDRAMSYIAPDIVCDAPAGRIEGAEDYRAFLGVLVDMLVGSEIIAAFGDGTTALVMYETATVPVADAPASECVTVVDGLIVRSRFIFDRAPFDAARARS